LSPLCKNREGIWVVAGASKGIGRAVADPLAEQGWSFIGRSTRSNPGLLHRKPQNEHDRNQSLGLDESGFAFWHNHLPAMYFTGP
jgi:NAD(P)-dependent dehydrogenase (short-subunit alcohol dehydrogenase family)